MIRRQYLLRRAILAILAIYLVVSVTFAFVALTPNWDLRGELGTAAFAGANTEELREIERSYEAARGLDRPIYERYAGWLVDITTLRWGVSHSLHAPVRQLVFSRLGNTLLYVVPGMALAVCGGVALGLYSARREYTAPDRLVRVLSYLAYGLPVFYLAGLAMSATGDVVQFGVFARNRPLLGGIVLPALLLGGSLLAGQLRYARAVTREYVNSDFVRLVRAKGGGEPRVVKHILVNAVVPLVSLFFTEMLAVLVVNVYVVEFVFGIDGLGTLSYRAIRAYDMPLVLGTTMVVAFAGIAGNFLQDVLYAMVDPRIEYD